MTEPESTVTQSADPRLLEALAHYESLLLAGRAATAEELCPDRPDLLEPLRAAIAQLEAFRRRFKSEMHPEPGPSGWGAPPEYTIEGEIGRGGMGVVYRARHRRLNRMCALKVIRSGEHADRREKERFEAEARAVAALQHPNIVQVYEVGEHNGQPFMALELCPGGSLADRLARDPLPAREAAALVRTLAQAMQAAHAANLIHRDLKPGNVLLTADGTPKITDFGLAKKLDEDGATRTGAVVGTPSYMPPEQARGDKEVGPAADIYALGAILYACLTGRPPFRAATALETIHQVLGTEPVPVRQLNPGVPRDLETIVHKCLQKEARQRYATAQALADDLGRSLDGRPIMARPVGAVERAVKWVKRNPVVSALAAAVLLVLTVGVTVASVLAWVANEETEAAIAARNDAQQKHTKLLEATDSLVTSAARGVLGPLVTQTERNELLPALSDQEIGALWELASTKEERLRLRVVELALQEPGLLRQLKDRSPFALHAAVGLGRSRRSQVGALLDKVLQDEQMAPEQQAHVALCLVVLGAPDRPVAGDVAALTQALTKTTNPDASRALAKGLAAVAAGLEPTEAASALTQALTKTTDGVALHNLAQRLAAVAVRLEPTEAARVCGLAADALTKALTKTTELWALARGLAAVAARLEPKAAAEAAAALTQALTKTLNPEALQYLAEGLAAVAARLEPTEAAEAAAALTQAITRTTNPAALRALAEGLAAVAAGLEPKAAASALAQALTKTANPEALRYLAQRLADALAAVAERLEPREAARVCGLAADTLTKALTKTMNPEALGTLAQGLAAVASHLEPTEAAEYLTQALTRTTNPAALSALARALAAARLEPKAAADAADALIQASTRTANRYALRYLAEGLAAVAARLEPTAAAENLTQALTRTTNPATLKVLAVAAARLEPRAAARVCSLAADALTQALTKTTDPFALQYLAEGLTAVAERLEPREAAEAAAALTQAMSKATNQRALAEVLAAVAARLEPRAAADALTQALTKTTHTAALRALAEALAARLGPRAAADALTQALTKTTNPEALKVLAQVFAAVGVRLEPKAAAEAASALTQAITRTTNPYALRALAEGLAAVAARLEPTEAARVCRLAADALTKALTKTTELWALAEGLAAVGVRLEPKAAAEAASALTQAMSQTTNPYALRALAEGLAAVAARLEPTEAARVCSLAADALTQAGTKTVTPAAMLHLSQGLAAVAARLEPRAAADALTQALTKTTNPAALKALAEGLAAVAARLEPRAAARVCSLAADTLTQALTKTTDPFALQYLAEGLTAVAERLEPKETTAVAATLTQAMARTMNPEALHALARLLAAVLSRSSFAPQPRSVVGAVAALGGPGLPWASLAWAQQSIDPPPPLPAQTLVDLLKHPFCVGEARRLVLAQLSRHYGRPFVDQWDFVEYVHQHRISLDLDTPPEPPK